MEVEPMLRTPLWANQTAIHPFGLALLLVCGAAMLLLPRRFAIVPIIVVTCFVAPGQRIVIASLDFNLLRLVVLVGWLRLVLYGEHRGLRWERLDIGLIFWASSTTVVFTIQRGTCEALINRLGYSFDALGMFFLFRALLRTWEDVICVLRAFIVVSIAVAGFFLIEHFTGRNLFGKLGGVPEITVMREGHLRCQGAFPHPILAGCFWASMLPVFAARWWAKGDEQKWAVYGTVAASVVVVTCMSSTPVMGVLCGVLAACLFPLRRQMRTIRYGIVLLLIGLHFVMRAPVWHLIARIDVISGNTAWHRFYLIDQAIRHFGEWALWGTPSTAHWDEWGLLWDVTNQYVLEGVTGGALTLVLFLVVIGLAFGAVGRLWRKVEPDVERVALAWALGVSLFVHCVNYIAISYFGQVTMVWYLHLAMIASLVVIRSMRSSDSRWRVVGVVPAPGEASHARTVCAGCAEPARSSLQYTAAPRAN